MMQFIVRQSIDMPLCLTEGNCRVVAAGEAGMMRDASLKGKRSIRERGRQEMRI